MCMDMRVDNCTGRSIDLMCVHVCADMCTDMCLDRSMGRHIEMCTGMRSAPPQRHIGRNDVGHNSVGHEYTGHNYIHHITIVGPSAVP